MAVRDTTRCLEIMLSESHPVKDECRQTQDHRAEEDSDPVPASCDVTTISQDCQFDALTDVCEAGLADEAENILRVIPRSKLKTNIGDLLHDACTRANYDLVRMLLRHGAGADVTCFTKETMGAPLHTACAVDITSFPCRVESKKILRIVRELLLSGADPQARDREMVTPLHLACQFSSLDVIRLLISHGADVTAADESGFTPLHKLLMTRSHRYQHDIGEEWKVSYFGGICDGCDILLEEGASIDETNRKTGKTALFYACRNSMGELVHRLNTENSADVSVVDNTDADILYWTCSQLKHLEEDQQVDTQLVEVACILIAAGCDVWRLRHTDSGYRLPLDIPNLAVLPPFLDIMFNMLAVRFPVPDLLSTSIGTDYSCKVAKLNRVWMRFSLWTGGIAVAEYRVVWEKKLDLILSCASDNSIIPKNSELNGQDFGTFSLFQEDSDISTAAQLNDSDMCVFIKDIRLNLQYLTRAAIRKYIKFSICHDRKTRRNASMLYLVPVMIEKRILPQSLVEYLFLYKESLQIFRCYRDEITQLFNKI